MITMKGYENRIPKVTVLLSTYNGEKYVKDLIDSVLNQKLVDITLCIRDDGSKDSTVNIIRDFHDHRIKLVRGKNIGPQRSFIKLMKEAEKSDYYAYCDQDDIWYEDKLYRAVRKMEEGKTDKPKLYISTYEVVDSGLKHIKKYDMNFERPLTMEETIIYRAPSACTMVFNERLMSILQRTNPSYVRMHDFWTLLVAEAVNADIITDDHAGLKYRQHSQSTVGILPTVGIRLKRYWFSAVKNKNERWRQAKCLYEEKRNIPLSKECIEALEKVVFYRYSFWNKWKLLGDRRFRAEEVYVNVLFLISVMLGIF